VSDWPIPTLGETRKQAARVKPGQEERLAAASAGATQLRSLPRQQMGPHGSVRDKHGIEERAAFRTTRLAQAEQNISALRAAGFIP